MKVIKQIFFFLKNLLGTIFGFCKKNKDNYIINDSTDLLKDLNCLNYSDVFDIFYVKKVQKEELEQFILLLTHKLDIEKIIKLINDTNIKGFRFKKNFLIENPSNEYIETVNKYYADTRSLCIIESDNTITDYAFKPVFYFIMQIYKQVEDVSFYQMTRYKYSNELDIFYLKNTKKNDREVKKFVSILCNEPNIEEIITFINNSNLKGFSYKETFLIKKPSINYMLTLKNYLDDDRLLCVIEHYNENRENPFYRFAKVSTLVWKIIYHYDMLNTFNDFLENNNVILGKNNNVFLQINNYKIFVKNIRENNYLERWLLEK